ncbi:MAG: hypothetical protein IJ586_06980 [Alloprevotella sp.]|nr:hypothetical protein [Alloprevotella sp.]
MTPIPSQPSEPSPARSSVAAYLYIAILLLAFVGIAAVFNFMPRPTVSEVENRNLKTLPAFSLDALTRDSAKYTSEVSSWYSDTEPFREQLLTLSNRFKDGLALKTDEAIDFVPAATPAATEQTAATEETTDGGGDIKAQAGFNRDADFEIGKAGIIVTGHGPKTRALMVFQGSAKGGTAFSASVSKYGAAFPSARVYAMVVPLSTEFYCPDKARSRVSSELDVINNIYHHLANGVQGVDVYTPLAQHAAEDIYLRTDHHWAPLGAYYAAQAFAKQAGVPFKDLSSYERKVVHRYVGTMYGFSKKQAVKDNPEDFVYYVPQGIDYNVTYYIYKLGKDNVVLGEGAAQKGPFFYHYKDGAAGAYCTFMGGDQKITQVRTGTKNGRRVLILKDSFGNAVPGYLFYSFEEIHVVDFRYFTRNIKTYLQQNGITDILFVNNIFNAFNNAAGKKYEQFLRQ